MQPIEYVFIPFSFLWYLFLILWHALIGLIFAFIPYALLPKKDVSKDIVLVTGGGSGFGRLFALEFTKLGSTVVIWDINLTGAENVVKECQELGGKAFAYKVDVSNSENVYKTADDVRKDVGDVTILINNAGVVAGRYLLDAPDHLIHKTLDINIKSHFWTVKAFARSILDNNHGHFVTIASMAVTMEAHK
ncbi:putative epidermal retinol dehydrogenase 2 isoform X2 [Apostichopus japonicus]|uniref:Putative epidermal retinol dehydrogenase 2 isoform X2 n=1 Tax=Stichopus japonicus TaxID=307972 RepID=A0A2G8LJ19_STIJA|nr:putative epidermal retinol dehydrogenase 2 isoform X2 [Apostichopus japonicus]